MDMPESSNRKRQRNVIDDEISEFTPLSKRINNLHINNSFFPFAKPHEHSHITQKPEMHRAMINEKLANFDCGGSRNIDSGIEPDSVGWNSHYSPDLTPAENPFYYDSNRVLYELYLERSRRSGNMASSSSHY